MGYLTNFYDAIVSQLDYHTDNTNVTALLPEVFWYKSPIDKVVGRKDTPYIQVMTPSVDSTAIDNEHTADDVTFAFLLGVSNTQNDQDATRNMLDLYERFCDSLYRKTDGTTYATKCLGPINSGRVVISMIDSQVDETLIQSIVTVVARGLKSGLGKKNSV